MKTIRLLFVVAICLSACILTASAALFGDVTGDGKLDTYDAIACLKAITDGDQSERFDVNGDDAFDVLDAMEVVKEIREVTGFSVAPKVTTNTANGYDFLTGTPAKSGTIYYYYTNSDVLPPTANDFWGGYAESSQFGYVSVFDGITMANVLLKPVSVVDKYKYVVLMLAATDESSAIPQLVVRKDVLADRNGFSVAPKVTANSSNGYDYLTGTPMVTGTIYYYYTDASTVPASAADFLNTFNSIASSEPMRVGVVSVTAGSAITQVLKLSSLVRDYNYVVIAIYNSTSGYTTPIVVVRLTQMPQIEIPGYEQEVELPDWW